MSLRDDIQRFKSNSKLFSLLDDKGVDRLAAIAREAKYEPNEAIVEQGAAANTFYVIVHGGVRVITDGRDEDKEVARLGAGQFFGEMGILNDEPRTATIRAIHEVRCLLFDKDPLLEVLADYPQIMHGLGSVGVERAARLVEVED